MTTQALVLQALPATGGISNLPRILDIGGFSPTPTGALQAAIDDGLTCPAISYLPQIADWDEITAIKGVEPIFWADPALIRLDTTVEKAYSLAGAALDLSPMATEPALATTPGGIEVFDFYRGGAATDDRLQTAIGSALSGIRGLTLLCAFNMQVGGTNERRIFEHTFANGANAGLYLRRSTSGFLQATGQRNSAQGAASMTSASLLAPGWNFAAITVHADDGNGALYLNDSVVASRTDFWSVLSGGSSTYANARIRLGGSETVNGGCQIWRTVVIPDRLDAGQVEQARQIFRARLLDLP